MAEESPKKPSTKSTLSKKTARNKANFLEMFKKTGNIFVSCKQANVGRRTFYTWKENDKKFRQDFEDAENSLLDFAEGKLINLINEKNPTAIIFFLKTKGKQRGYIEPHYMNIKGMMEHSQAKMNVKDLKKSHDKATGK